MTSLFKTPATPQVKKAAPLPSEAQTTAARKKRIASEQETGGRSSTLLSTGGREKLGA